MFFNQKMIFGKHINVAIDTVKAASIKIDEEKMYKRRAKFTENQIWLAKQINIIGILTASSAFLK